jgi:hypothetical protein
MGDKAGTIAAIIAVSIFAAGFLYTGTSLFFDKSTSNVTYTQNDYKGPKGGSRKSRRKLSHKKNKTKGQNKR